MIGTGLLLFFLVPGLLGYCALYGTFHSGRSIAPEPPAATSIEALTLVLLGSAVVHVGCAAFVYLNHVIARRIAVVSVPPQLFDPYRAAFDTMSTSTVTSEVILCLVGIALLQGVVFYGLIRFVLRSLARHDKLPHSIYGWATEIANAADDDDRMIVVYVMTNHDFDGRPIVYAGILYEMGLKSDRSITRLSLWDCERYLADLSSPITDRTLPEPSSRFPFLLIEGSQIRNVAFEVIAMDDTLIAAPPSPYAAP